MVVTKWSDGSKVRINNSTISLISDESGCNYAIILFDDFKKELVVRESYEEVFRMYGIPDFKPIKGGKV